MEYKPFVKWAGGKRGLLPELREVFPDAEKYDTYVEPFLGGGAVMFDMLGQSQKPIFVNDVNTKLISAYRVLTDDVQRNMMLHILARYQDDWNFFGEDDKKALYYKVRHDLNAEVMTAPEVAAAFIFLNKTCFNGLWRVNRKNQFNVPVGDLRDKVIYDESELTALGKAMDGRVVFMAGDYKATARYARPGVFYYIDPPYRKLAGKNGFTSYADGDFNDDDQRELAAFCRELNAQGAMFLLSNSDPTAADPKDDFFDKLYAGFEIQRIQAPRSVSASGNFRGKVSELLIRNYSLDG